jgi:Bacterial SH3 domain
LLPFGTINFDFLRPNRDEDNAEVARLATCSTSCFACETCERDDDTRTSSTRYTTATMSKVAQRHEITFFLALLPLVLTWGCVTTPPAPSTREQEQVLASLTVAAADIPMYSQASSSAPVVASLQSGARLALLERQGEWLLVKTSSGMRGYIQSSSLVSPRCTADRPVPVIVEEPMFRFDARPPHGRVVLEAEYAADAQLTGTRVLENTVGDPSYEQRALDDLRRIRFLPPTEDCMPRPFVYTFTRQF